MPLIKKILQISFSVFILSIGLSGCSTKEDTPYVERPVEELYDEGRAHLAAARYEKAATSFDEIERQHPYSEWAAQSQLMSAYSYYMGQKYEKALVGVESFIVLHPSHMDVAYAYYLRGLCYYEQISTVQRDQRVTDLALNAFWELVKKCPGTIYARDARIKIELLRNNLAARYMDVGRFYQRKKAYVAALNRFKEVVTTYQTTAHVEEALHRLVEIYLALGFNNEARKVATVLGHNFPGSYWYLYSYQLMNDIPYDKLEFTENSSDSSPWIDALEFNYYDDKIDGSDTNDLVNMPVKDTKSNIPSDLARPIERFGTHEGYVKAKQKIDHESDTIDKLTDYLDLSTPDDHEQKIPASIAASKNRINTEDQNSDAIDTDSFDTGATTDAQTIKVQKLDKNQASAAKMVN